MNWRREYVRQASEIAYNREFDSTGVARMILGKLQPELKTADFYVSPVRAHTFLEGLKRAAQIQLADNITWYESGKARPWNFWYDIQWEDKEGRTHDLELFKPVGGSDHHLMVMGRSRKVLDEFAQEMIEFCNRPEGRVIVYSGQEWSPSPEMDQAIEVSPWEDVVLPEMQKEEIIRTTNDFFDSRELYEEMGAKWRRGVMFVGPPGTGKTMIAKAVANQISDVPVLYVRDLTGYNGKDIALGQIFQRARNLAPCILILEDIDGLVKENRTVFLNELDGFYGNDGILLLASSNHPEEIDEALLKRPSRFDRVFWVTLPEYEERKKFCQKFMRQDGIQKRLSPKVNVDTLAATVAKKTNGFTLAYLKEAFVGATLEYVHQGYEILDENFTGEILVYLDRLKKGVLEAKNTESLAKVGDFSTRAGFGSGVPR